MIRSNKMTERELMNSDIEDIVGARNSCEVAAMFIGMVIQYIPLDKNIEKLKKLGVEACELSRRIGAFASALQMAWEYNSNFDSAYRKAIKGDDSGEHRFYDEILPLMRNIAIYKKNKEAN